MNLTLNNLASDIGCRARHVCAGSIARIAVLMMTLVSVSHAADLSPGMSLQYDAVRADLDSEGHVSAEDFRRARLSLRGALGDRVRFKLEYDAKPDAWTDAYIEGSSGRVSWRAGQQKTPFGLEQLNSDRGWMFMESAVTDLLTVGRRLGVAAEMPWRAGRVQVMAFDQDLRGRNEGIGLAVRGVWTPVLDPTQTLHLGAAGAHQRLREGRVSLNPHPESVTLPFRPLAVPAFDDAETSTRFGLEAAWLRGPWTVQSEALMAEFDRPGAADTTAQAGYVSVSRILTGESRRYRAGTVSAPDPASRFGALELAARIARMRVDDARPATSGTLDTFTVGFNWYLAYEIRLMLDGTYAKVSAGDDLRLIATRLQIAF